DTPVWVFHGAKDEVVPLEHSMAMADALERAGGNVRLTVYPEAGHDAWTETYDNPALYEWFLQHALALAGDEQ
ncbi:MAG: prolyl oligopeptidase family serine peptidase, partial [Chloroflexi bacterium]|nr:prolyl oligopeptidase family serine peptidase [Chloroflexota bacterium]